MLRDWWDSSAGLFGCFGFFYRYAVRGDVDYVANHGVCDSRLGFCAHQSKTPDADCPRAEGLWVSRRMGVPTGRYVAADGNVALSRSLFAPATCQSEEARARCDQAREPRRIAVTDGRSSSSLGEVRHRYHHDAEGEQYPKPDRRSNQLACVHFAPSRCNAQRELCNLIVLGLRRLVRPRPTNENSLHRRPPLASVGPWLFRATGRNPV
jgi:hypothetical protein